MTSEDDFWLPRACTPEYTYIPIHMNMQYTYTLTGRGRKGGRDRESPTVYSTKPASCCAHHFLRARVEPLSFPSFWFPSGARKAGWAGEP